MVTSHALIIHVKIAYNSVVPSHRLVVMHRWVYDKGPFLVKESGLLDGYFPCPIALIRKMACRSMGKKAWAQGTGRHSPEEVYAIMRADLKALSVYLGKASSACLKEVGKVG